MNEKFDRDERGFTLVELMVVILLMGIIAAIAIPNWFGLIQSREVESAANQLAADLRLAHNSASNQVGTDWKVTLNPGLGAVEAGADYTVSSTQIRNKTLPGSVEISTPSSPKTLTFKSNGSVEGFDGEIQIKNGARRWTVTVISTTSEVKVKRD